MRTYRITGKDIARELSLFDIGDFKELKAMKTEQEIDRLIKRLNRSVIKWADTSISEAYRKAHMISRTRLEILGAERDKEFSPITHKNAIGDWTDKTIDGLLRANMSIKPNVAIYIYLVRQASKQIAQVQAFDFADEEIIAGLLDDAILEGASRGELESILRVHFKRDLYERKFINMKGKNYDMIKYARMLARTQMRIVQSEAVKNTCRQFNNDLIEISSHGTTCRSNICQQYEGNVYSISGSNPTYPYLDSWPPWHPNCLSDRNSRVLTDNGLVPIYKIKKGDMVFTHKGRFRPVVNTMKRNFKGQLIYINGLGVTYNHRMFTKSGLVPAGNLTGRDKLFELYSKAGKSINPGLNSNYFPSQRSNFSVPLFIRFSSFPVNLSIDFKINIAYRKIKNIFIYKFFLNKVNFKFFKNLCSIFSSLRLISQKIFRHPNIHFLSQICVTSRVIGNHSDFIFPICFRSRIGNSPLYVSPSRASFNSKMIKKFNMTVRGKRIIPKHFTNLSYVKPFIIKSLNDFLQRVIKLRLNRFNSIKKLLSLSASERACLGIPRFIRTPTNNTSVHNASFVLGSVKNYSPYMLPYTGEVYNIEVQDDHSYIAEGFLVKNCEHSAAPTSEVALGFRSQYA